MSSQFLKSPQDFLSVEHPTYIGGGTDIMPLLKNGVRDDKEFVFLSRADALRGIEKETDHLIIGAAVTLTELAESAQVNTCCAAVAQAAAVTASPQIRNIATVGGNIMQDRRCIYYNQPRLWRSALPRCFKTGGCICHQIPNSPVCRALYYSDVATALIAHGAEVEYIEDRTPHRTSVEALVARHSAANGLDCRDHLPILVTRFFIPLSGAKTRSRFYKYAMRTTIDFPLINFALCQSDAESMRLVAGAVAPTPVLLEETAALIASNADEDTIISAAEQELQKLARPIREACIPPAIKRQLYRQVREVLSE